MEVASSLDALPTPVSLLSEEVSSLFLIFQAEMEDVHSPNESLHLQKQRAFTMNYTVIFVVPMLPQPFATYQS